MHIPHTLKSNRIAFLFSLTLILFATVSSKQAEVNIAGHWEGAFSRFGAIQDVQLDFSQIDTGYTATYSIPDMILYRRPVRNLVVTPDSISFRLFWGGFNCIYTPEVDEITGENSKWNPSVSIHLKRTYKKDRFRIEPIKFSSSSLTLYGDMLLPDRKPPYPVVIVIEGSSTEGRKLWTYRSIGDLFAQNGIAALVYDKRGVGESDGSLDSASFDDLTNDAVAAIDYVRSRSDIDINALGLFGISQGGWIAPLAARRSGQVSFIINLGGPAVSIWQQELDRVEYSMKAGNLGENEPDKFSPEEIAAALEHLRLGFEVVKKPELWNEWMQSVKTAGSSRWASYVALDSSLNELQYWLRYDYDPAFTLKKTKIPLLALFGQNDVLVPPSTNVGQLEKYMTEAGNDRAKIVVFPGVGHDFFTGATLVGGDWNWPTGFWRWNRRAPGLADSILAFVRQYSH